MTRLFSVAPLIDRLAGAVLKSASTNCGEVFTLGTHQHPHGELFLIKSGYLKSESKTGRWVIPAGHLCWVPPGTEHGADTRLIDGVRIYIAPGLCDALPDKACVMRSTSLISAVIDRLVKSARGVGALTDPESRLLGVLRDEIEQARSTPIMLPMPRDSRLRAAAKRWLAHPDDKIGLDDLAREAGMSRRSFTRNFKLDTGLSLGEWRQVARLMHGIDMLAAGKSVTQTAFALGFDSTSSFVALCQRHTGMSPKILAHGIRSPVAPWC